MTMSTLTRKLLALCGALAVLGGCAPVQLLNATIPRDGYTRTAAVPYGDDARQKLDIYQPDRPLPDHPVVVFYYGGSWQSGRRQDYLFVGQALASRGYTVVVPDYRLYPQVSYPAFMQDVAAAFVWTHAHIADYGGNPGDLAVMGHSAGAYNAIMLATDDAFIREAGGDPAWIRKAVGLAGPYDFRPFTDPAIIALFSPVEARLTQPITYVRPGLPPMFLAAGSADQEVGPGNSLRMADKLRAAGDRVDYKLYPGLDHIDIVLALAYRFRDKAPVLDDVDAFLRGD